MPDTIRDQKIKTAVRATDARTAGKTKFTGQRSESPSTPRRRQATNDSLELPERTSGSHALLDQLAADGLLGFDQRINRSFLGPFGRLDLEIQGLGRELLGGVDVPRGRFLRASRVEALLGDA